MRSRRKTMVSIVVALGCMAVLLLAGRFSFVRSAHNGMTTLLKPLLAAMHPLRVWRESGGNGNSDQASSAALNAARVRQEALQQENAGLRTALGFREARNVNMQGARVLLYGQEFGQEYVLVDAGARTGIKKGDVVVDHGGLLVGTVREIQDESAKISIATNRDEVYEAEFVPLGGRTFAKGIGGRTLSLELISGEAPPRRGDFLMLPLKGMKQSAIVIGEIVKLGAGGIGGFKEARAILLAHPELLHDVFIIIE